MKKCIEYFPPKIIDMIQDISSTFASPQKASKLRKIMAGDSLTKEKVKGIKSYVKTLCSSFHDCIERIVELKDSIVIFLGQEASKKQNE